MSLLCQDDFRLNLKGGGHIHSFKKCCFFSLSLWNSLIKMNLHLINLLNLQQKMEEAMYHPEYSFAYLCSINNHAEYWIFRDCTVLWIREYRGTSVCWSSPSGCLSGTSFHPAWHFLSQIMFYACFQKATLQWHGEIYVDTRTVYLYMKCVKGEHPSPSDFFSSAVEKNSLFFYNKCWH